MSGEPKDVRREGKPFNRLTRMADQMTEAFDRLPEHRDGDKCIVFLDDGKMGGICIHGYDNDIDAMVDLFMHMKAMFKANGKDLDFVGLGENGVWRG